MSSTSLVGHFATHHWKGIIFVILGLCLAGIHAAVTMPSSVFPQTNFPRVVIMVDNGEMPAAEMMATITKPIEEVMKDVPGVVNLRSDTSRGSAVVNVYFSWNVDIVQTELHVRSRLEQARAKLPPTVEAHATRLTFSAFPIAGISLTSKQRTPGELWDLGQYTVKPKFLRVDGVARVDLVGGQMPEYHVVADPVRMQAFGLTLPQVVETLRKSNLVSAAGLHEERHMMFLTLIDGRVSGVTDIENLAVAAPDGRPVLVRDFAEVKPAAEPARTVVTAMGRDAVLVMVRSQPDGSTLAIADALKAEMRTLKHELPPDVRMTFFYDQSLLVRDSVRSVWDAILFGLILSVIILYLFLKDWGSTLVAILVIPVTVLVTLVAMKMMGMSYNLMTLGGIAAAIGLVIDDAIVVVEAIHTKMATGLPRLDAVHTAIGEIFLPLTGSTLTPVVVFVPLAFLDGLPGVFFRALAMTMTVSLLTSLVLALTLTPSLAAWIIRVKPRDAGHEIEEGGFILRPVMAVYDFAVRLSLAHPLITLELCGLLLIGGMMLYRGIGDEFLPKLDEGGTVIDYVGPPGTSLTETDRALRESEKILAETPEVESYSRRTGTALGLELTEPHAGDFLVKFKADRKRSTDDLVAELGAKFKKSQPQIEWELRGILGDLIGDLTWSPSPIEIKLFSTDLDLLKEVAPAVKTQIDEIHGVAETKDGLVVAGPSLTFRVNSAAAQRFGLRPAEIAEAVEAAKLGTTASSVLQGDRTISIRVVLAPAAVDRVSRLKELPLRTPTGETVLLSQVAEVVEEPGELEMHRENLRQYVAVTGRPEKRDLGSVMKEITEKLGNDARIPKGVMEFGGTYKQELEAFHNLMIVMIMAILAVFTVLLLEFRSFLKPLAIVAGALLALLGTIVALRITGTTENIISRLGAIIGVGIVAKNGILMLDFVDHLRNQGLTLVEALVHSGRRRLRPVLMTSMAAALGMLPLAYGVGSGADMLRPLAIAVIGALCVSVLLSLVATPTIYYLLMRLTPWQDQPSSIKAK